MNQCEIHIVQGDIHILSKVKSILSKVNHIGLRLLGKLYLSKVKSNMKVETLLVLHGRISLYISAILSSKLIMPMQKGQTQISEEAV